MKPTQSKLQADAVELSDMAGDIEAELVSARGYDQALIEAAAVAIAGALTLLRPVHEQLEEAEFAAFRAARAIGLAESRARWEARGRKNAHGVAEEFQGAADDADDAERVAADGVAPVENPELAGVAE